MLCRGVSRAGSTLCMKTAPSPSSGLPLRLLLTLPADAQRIWAVLRTVSTSASTAGGWSARPGTSGTGQWITRDCPGSLHLSRAPGKCKAVPTFEKGVCPRMSPGMTESVLEVGTKLPPQGQRPSLREGLPGGSPAWLSATARAPTYPPVRLVYLPSRSAQMPPPGRLLRLPRCCHHRKTFRLPCWQHLPDFGCRQH